MTGAEVPIKLLTLKTKATSLVKTSQRKLHRIYDHHLYA